MSTARPPTRLPEPPPPPSRSRPRTGPDAFDLLSREGAAAVLVFARSLLEDERRRAPHVVNSSLRVFAGHVESVARSAEEGVHDDCVFIAPLFHLLRERGEVPSCPTLATFKAWLLRAHERGLLLLTTCRQVENLNPLLVAASVIHRRRTTYHLVHRWSRPNVYIALQDAIMMLSSKARVAAEDYARKVREDEKRREGRPRLITLSPDAFAARVQAVVNERPGDALIVELFRELDDRGEVTGLGLEAFKARLHAAHRDGLLALRGWAAGDGPDSAMTAASATDYQWTMLHLVQRTADPLPIPWGRPALVVRHAQVWSDQRHELEDVVKAARGR